jgi:putative oxidoreductase
MKFILRLLIVLPRQIGEYFLWAGPLIARLIVGYVFVLSGWYKLNHSMDFVSKFVDWGIPYANIFVPVVSDIEFFGAIFLVIGLFTCISAGALAVVMIVAVITAKAMEIDPTLPIHIDHILTNYINSDRF